tara:strand:- start:101 stop:640 length:540 start_codon:yes stop_codon:yes gene_type:complete
MRKNNTHGGGDRTNFNGLNFEKRTNFITSINNNPNFKVEIEGKTTKIFFKNKYFGNYIEQHEFYKFLESKSVDWKNTVSKKYIPDGVFINKVNKKIYIIEKKFQEVSGSVDEKLQTCDFKKKIYQKLVNELKESYIVEYIFLLNNFFEKRQYKDVKNYIKSVGCHYYIDRMEPKEIGIF